MTSKLTGKITLQKVDRRRFLKGAAATLGGAALLSTMAATNFEAAAEEGQAYVIFSDIVRGSGGSPAGDLCLETSLFKQGEQAVFRVVVFDAKTGTKVNTTDEVAKRGLKVTVEVEGQKDPLELAHGAHPKNGAPEILHFYFAKGFIFPPNVSGKLGYTVKVVDKDGGQGVLAIEGYTPGGKDNDSFPAALTIKAA